MNEQEFWILIEKTKKKSKGDYELQKELIEQELTKLNPKQIIEFENLFSKYTNQAYNWKLWGAAYIINGGCSDDCFMDFRGWLIAQGKGIYEKALSDPDSLVDLKIDEEATESWEGYGYCAVQAYREVTGEEMPVDPSGEYNHPSEPSGDDWQEKELKKLLPRLSKKYEFE